MKKASKKKSIEAVITRKDAALILACMQIQWLKNADKIKAKLEREELPLTKKNIVSELYNETTIKRVTGLDIYESPYYSWQVESMIYKFLKI